MASSHPRTSQGISFSEAPFIEPAVASTYASPFTDGEADQPLLNPASGYTSSSNAQNAPSGSSSGLSRRDVVQRSSFNPSASIWLPAASRQRGEQNDSARPPVVGYPHEFRAAGHRQDQNQIQALPQVQNQVQGQILDQTREQFDLVSFALTHTQGQDEDTNVGMP
ncbi:hypothetical protein V8C35DRAFT_152124 [Trichoderma chlorosporum]